MMNRQSNIKVHVQATAKLQDIQIAIQSQVAQSCVKKSSGPISQGCGSDSSSWIAYDNPSFIHNLSIGVNPEEECDHNELIGDTAWASFR